MGDGGFRKRIRGGPAWAPSLAALLLAWCGVALGQDLSLARLAADPPAAEVVAGQHDAALQARPDARILFESERSPRWWRIAADRDIPAAQSPQLVLQTPYSTRVEAWLPGRTEPTRHAVYGADADLRYSPRALVIDLPDGLRPGQALWLRVDAPAGYPMAVSVQSRDAVHRADLAHVAWRSAILTAMLVLALLAAGFWAGTGDRSYGFLAGMLLFGLVYVASVGGELRAWPVLGRMLAESPQLSRMGAFLGLLCSNLFQQRYLDMPRRLPVLSRILHAATLVVLALLLFTSFSAAPFIAIVGNLALIVSALVVIAAGARLAWNGEWPAILLLVSWLPLAVFSILRAMELNGFWIGPEWLEQTLAASFAFAGLLLTLGLAHKLRELRRDRDMASARADIDALTGAASRPAIERGLLAAVTAARLAGERLSVAFVDIDHFKRINDAHGHPVGDRCLRLVCQSMRDELDQAALLGRYGGDEFLLVMPRTGLEDAIATGERVRASVGRTGLAVGAQTLRCSLSAGVAELQPGESPEQLLARADAALYAGKSGGRDRVVSAPVSWQGEAVA